MRLLQKATRTGSSTLQLSETDYLKSPISVVIHASEHKEPKFDVHSIDLSSLDGRHLPRGYQYDGIQFIVDSGFNCIIGDKQRLGKTPQSLCGLRIAMQKFLNGRPCLIIVGGANLWQWIDEHQHWVTG